RFAMVVELGCWFVTLRKQHSQPTATAFLIFPLPPYTKSEISSAWHRYISDAGSDLARRA
ncbi:hypothetical protein, partial [Burkholderia cenocepacia]|uniref:hypothetical protein n=1 Tax=Burkholderia cenocepacia TaxID=95486 RepID=UPI002653F354